MRLDDRSADGEPDTQAAPFRGEETLEQTARVILGYAGAGVFHFGAQRHLVGLHCTDRQTPFGAARHCLYRIDREIGEHLLQLYAVGDDIGQTCCEIEHRFDDCLGRFVHRNVSR